MQNRDQKKNQLENIIKSSTDAIQNQLIDYKDKGKNILVVGGIIVAAYAFSRLFTDKEDEDEVKTLETTKEPSFLGSAVTGVVTSVLLTLAKNKILELIEQLNENEQPNK
ncbi:hypothetical protein [Lacihabitans soyangensis]|jgi:uncharacterized BrkB/YihY/UPF0761 family membrane protein|uniref:Uncharacterized protein n=1 Tax=Lacihabitans soyangensis TaxID=869394 RepID=A0AAE3H7M6_9BACT|nr:hypothetical protein [Lacihabitans soyangensis]MCP9764595.1 hypothetical protein [Lacihabitans soyangensis]